MSSTKKKKRGRKPWIPKKDFRGNAITSRFTDRELKKIQQSAVARGISVSALIQHCVRRSLGIVSL